MPGHYISYSLNSLKEVIKGTILGVIKGDARSLDYSSHVLSFFLCSVLGRQEGMFQKRAGHQENPSICCLLGVYESPYNHRKVSTHGSGYVGGSRGALPLAISSSVALHTVPHNPTGSHTGQVLMNLKAGDGGPDTVLYNAVISKPGASEVQGLRARGFRVEGPPNF